MSRILFSLCYSLCFSFHSGLSWFKLYSFCSSVFDGVTFNCLTSIKCLGYPSSTFSQYFAVIFALSFFSFSSILGADQNWCNSVMAVGLLAQTHFFSSSTSLGFMSKFCDDQSNASTLLSLSQFVTMLRPIVLLEDQVVSCVSCVSLNFQVLLQYF